MSRMPYRRFFAFNVIGGVAWATMFTLAGYLAGESYERVEAATGWGSWLAGAVVLTFVAVRVAVRRRRARTPEPSGASEHEDEMTTSTRDEVLI
jgi:membrane protein DedA with SNARE-associated domain